MATKKIKCPFSGRACKNCPLYRSRHYSLCFNTHYQDNVEYKDSITKSVEGSILVHGFHSLGHNAYKQ